MYLRLLYTLTAFVLLCVNAAAQPANLRKQINAITQQIDGITGVSVLHLESRDTLSLNGNAHMVMHSVMKLPIAMVMLHQVDLGKRRLDEKIWITKADLPENYSPLRDKYPDGNVYVRIDTLLSYMVSLSDNDACDIVVKLLGGMPNAERYIHRLGVKNISLKATEAQMASAWPVQYTNWCHPKAITQLLDMLYKGRILSKTSNNFLWKIMLQTSTGPKRIRGLLPADAQIAHKTGTSPVNNQGLAAATNDAGIMILPNGEHVALSVFITDSHATADKREGVIAQIAKAVWDAYSTKRY